LAEEPATRPATLHYIAAHLDLVSRQSLPELIVAYRGNSCSAADAAMWSNAIGPRIAGDVGAQLALNVALEKTRDCERLKKRRGAELVSALG
jgi:hypothetical protein